MIDDFRTDLVLQAAVRSPEDLVMAMGYPQPTAANLSRLKHVLDSPELGLADVGYDLIYSSKPFLLALCSAVGMNRAFADKQITRIERSVELERHAFKPFIWVDTGFRRINQPIFAMAACKYQQYLYFPKGFWRYPLDWQFGYAKCRIREHVVETAGKLGILGRIQQYWFYYKNETAYLLTLDGEVTGKHVGSVPWLSNPGLVLALVARRDGKPQQSMDC